MVRGAAKRSSTKLGKEIEEREDAARAKRTPVPQVGFPDKAAGLFVPMRYKVLWGGRGSGKSESAGGALILTATQKPLRVLCARELQVSMRDSVHRLLVSKIDAMGLKGFYDVENTIIRGKNGSEFIFKGLRHNFNEIKSMHGIDRVWVEEAQGVTKESWRTLIPTIRQPGSEIWVTFNPVLEKDDTYQRFVIKGRPDAWVQQMNWYDNKWFPPDLEIERQYDYANNFDTYAHIWEGACLKNLNSAIFADKVSVESFEVPRIDKERRYFGADWGFSTDPTVLIRCFIKDDCLYVDGEAYGHGVETDQIGALFAGNDRSSNFKPRWENPRRFKGLLGSMDNPIKADNSRPETISFVKRQGFMISPADKWKGSVEDGITHLRGFKRIIVHPSCEHLAMEARLYSYKVDKDTGDVLTDIVDKHNHCWDALRYALVGFIQKRGSLAVWERMAGYG